MVHESGYEDRTRYEQTRLTLDAEEGLRNLGVFSDGEGAAALYELR